MQARWARHAACGAWLAAVAVFSAAHAAEPMVDFVVVRADTLIGLSKNVLVSPTAWREVARINRLPDPNRIVPGQVLSIPARLLRATPVGATIVSAVGDVRVSEAFAPAGTVIAEGQSLQTGAGGSAVVALADGSRVQVPPSSLAQLAASRNFGQRAPPGGPAAEPGPPGASATSGWFAGSLRLLRGSVEVFAAKVLRIKPLEVVTPTAVVGVRGTQYRVAIDDAAAGGRTHSEVLEGAVRFEAAHGPARADLCAGFGAALDAGASAPAVARLLAAPDLSSITGHFERPLVRFGLPGAAALRVQVASDAAFEKIVSDQRIAAGAEVRIAGLEDAQWHLRARRIDERGIEGYDAQRSFVLKARPEPPAYRAPRADAKQTVGSVELAWAPNLDAPRARVQVAQDPGFERIVQDQDNLNAPTLRVAIGAPGTYYWRVGSIRPDGDHGPFADAQRFELRALPEPASVDRASDSGALIFRWSGRAQDRHEVQLARDPQFAQIVARDELPASEWTLPMPTSGGRYYFRYRSIESDGYLGPYSETLTIEVPRDWTGLLLLLPALLLL